MIGIAGRQGNGAEHGEVLDALGAGWRWVVDPLGMAGLDALILPGGETTTQRLLWGDTGLWEALKAFHGPMLGTCAGAIHLAGETVDGEETLGLMDTLMERNGWGHQLESFRGRCPLPWGTMEALFIRAPRFRRTGKDVEVLASCRGEPAVVRSGRFWAATCHPEALGDATLHEAFLAAL